MYKGNFSNSFVNGLLYFSFPVYEAGASTKGCPLFNKKDRE